MPSLSKKRTAEIAIVDPTHASPVGVANDDRRRFLRVSCAGALLLTSASFLVRQAVASVQVAPTHVYGWLEPEDALIIRRVAPVLLRGALPTGTKGRFAVEEIVAGFDGAVGYFPSSVRSEIRQLFDLLRNPITRVVVAGVWSSWDHATPEQVRSFLDRWQHSYFQTLRGAYDALHDLIAGSWYGNPKAWPATGYPGPPKL